MEILVTIMERVSSHKQGCQFCFGRCFVFSIGTECFGVLFRGFSKRFGVPFRGFTVYIYIYIYNSTNQIQIQNKLIINYALQNTNTMSSKHNFKILNISK